MTELVNGRWWIVKVYDEESGSMTELGKFGTFESIQKDIEEDGLWTFVSARLEPTNDNNLP